MPRSLEDRVHAYWRACKKRKYSRWIGDGYGPSPVFATAVRFRMSCAEVRRILATRRESNG